MQGPDAIRLLPAGGRTPSAPLANPISLLNEGGLMPRLRKDQRQLDGAQFAEFVKMLLDAYDVDSFAAMLRIQLDRRLEHLTKTADFPTMLFNVISKAEMEGWSAELLQGAARPTASACGAVRICPAVRSGAAHH